MVSMVKDSLDYFNALGNNEVIDYAPRYGKYSRPTKIVVKPFEYFWEAGLAGQTFVSYDECTIYVNQDEPDADEFRKTVIHEYLHCMGYDHIDDRKDVMYYASTPGIDATKSIQQYANEIRKRKK